MTEETNTPDAVVEAPAAAEAAPSKTVTPRAPKLSMVFEGKEIPLLKYAFPVKAAKFPVKVNGTVVDAACTAGRGKDYTYLLINNISFYGAGHLPVDAEVAINFPDGYKFDEAQAARVSTYKSKAKKDAPAAVPSATPDAGSTPPADTGEQAQVEAAAVDVSDVRSTDVAAVVSAAKATRRAR